jgi:putative flippase GtrA
VKELLKHLRHPLVDQLGRYALAGAVVAGIYVLGTLVLDSFAGLPIQAAILIAYVTAVSLHFVLQRTFVFHDRSEFALGVGAQIRSYVVIGAIQYAFTFASTTWLPGLLGISAQLVYLGCVGVISLATFSALRSRVFHEADKPASS